MQIVIDIPNWLYNAIMECEEPQYSKSLGDAVRDGTPLPKHGRLIDADIIKDFKNKIKDYKKDYKFTQEEIFNILERYEIKYAPTIIRRE